MLGSILIGIGQVWLLGAVLFFLVAAFEDGVHEGTLEFANILGPLLWPYVLARKVGEWWAAGGDEEGGGP